MSDEMQIDIQQLNEQTAIIHLKGDVTTFAEEDINTAYRSISIQGCENVIFNFRRDDYVNSAGVAILIGIVTEARKNDQRLIMAMPSTHFQKIFRMVGLTQYADVYVSLEDAINSVVRPEVN